MNKILITEEEKNRILNLHKLRSKNHYLLFENEEDEINIENLKTKSEIMALQQAILSTEQSENKIKMVEDGTTAGTNIVDRKSNQGKSNLPEFSGSSLCDGSCTVLRAVDGIKGKNTISAIESYKDNQTFKDNLKKELDKVEETYMASSNDWRIPANKNKIEAFQLFIWKVIEYNQPKVDPKCEEECEYKSILCGENPCKADKAVDGFWGPNTKKAWSEYKDKYFDIFNFTKNYEDVSNYIKDNLDDLVNKYAIPYDNEDSETEDEDNNNSQQDNTPTM